MSELVGRLFTPLFRFWQRYEHRIGLIAMAVGFVFDLFLAKRPDSVPDNILLVTYLFVAGACIVILNLRSHARERAAHPTEPLLLLLILQFCFGGLSSNLLVLYGKSGMVGGSALFIGLLASFVLGNEFLKSRYAQLRLNVALYYFLLLTYLVIAVPTFLLHSIGARVFLLSGAASLLVIAAFLGILFFAVFRGNRRKQLYEVSLMVLCVYLIFNGLYLLNIIPPVPLSLKEIGVYHSLSRDSAGNYIGTYEAPEWFVFWRDTSATYTYTPGQPAYCFSAVYAPGGLSAPIYHRWEYFDTDTGHWITIARVQFPIVGGRQEGYRGFSTKQKLADGKWRCDVETAQGQLIGRITFTMTEGSTTALSTARL